ncbi:MAG: ribonuclease P protein component [bacterium]
MSERLESFPKEERVRSSDDFSRILRQGRLVRGRNLNAYWCVDASEGAVNRVGVAAGRKLGKAVVRNLLKRRLREAYRRNKRELPCRGIAIILVASRRMIGTSAPEVESDLRQLLSRIEAQSRDDRSPGATSSGGAYSPSAP